MLAKRRRGYGIDNGRHSHAQRRFDVRDRSRERMRDLANAMAFTHLRRLNASSMVLKKADRHVRRLHLRYPIVASILRENLVQNRPQLLPVGRAQPPRGEFGTGDKIGPAEHVGHEAPYQPVVGAGDVERPVCCLVDADGGDPFGEFPNRL